MVKSVGFWFDKDKYIKMDADLSSIGLSKISATVNGETTDYQLGGIEKKLLYANPDTTTEMTGDTLFMETELEGYDYLEFIITDTDGDYEVNELCEIAPLKAHGGQFVISYPVTSALYVRKIYRSAGAVKPSTSVYDIGKTTGDKTKCIVKEVYAVKGGF